MKNLLLIVLALGCFSADAQNWGHEFGSNYNYAKPVGRMSHFIRQGHGFGAFYGLVMPGQYVVLGAEITFAQYGNDKSRQQYTMDDGTVAPMNIIVSNDFTSAAIYSKFYFQTEGLLRPYLIAKLGYSAFRTDLGVYDPDDRDHCEPVDSDVLLNDGTIIASIGAGFKVDFASVFKNLPKNMLHLESSVGFTQGGEVTYMNVDSDAHSHGAHQTDDITAKFINTNTKVVHQHLVGHKYVSPLRMTELRVGVSMNFSR